MMNIQNQYGSIVVVSSSNIKPKSLIKLITGASNISEDTELQKVFQPWQIDTKYYIANVNFYGITEYYVRTEDFNNSVQAMIIHMDSNKESGLEDLEKWAAIEDECDPEIKLLISNYCTTNTKITRAKATEWCLKRGFELIELYPSKKEGEESEEDEIIKEKVGVDRIVEALQNHVWPYLKRKDDQMKNTNDPFSFPSVSGAGETLPVHNSLLNDVNAANSSSTSQMESKQPIQTDAVEQFAHLLSQLCMYKESMKSLSRNQRKQCAEEIATAFWNAMGGDEEEVPDV